VPLESWAWLAPAQPRDDTRTARDLLVEPDILDAGIDQCVPDERRHDPFLAGRAPFLEQADREIGDRLVASYVDEDVDRVELIYNRYVSPLTQYVRRQTLLPRGERLGDRSDAEWVPGA